MDFSDGKGFYLGTDFWKSYDWAKRGGLTKKKKGVAVLVFKASRQSGTIGIPRLT